MPSSSPVAGSSRVPPLSSLAAAAMLAAASCGPRAALALPMSAMHIAFATPTPTTGGCVPLPLSPDAADPDDDEDRRRRPRLVRPPAAGARRRARVSRRVIAELHDRDGYRLVVLEQRAGDALQGIEFHERDADGVDTERARAVSREERAAVEDLVAGLRRAGGPAEIAVVQLGARAFLARIVGRLCGDTSPADLAPAGGRPVAYGPLRVVRV